MRWGLIGMGSIHLFRGFRRPPVILFCSLVATCISILISTPLGYGYALSRSLNRRPAAGFGVRLRG